jgi:hypothetical protein
VIPWVHIATWLEIAGGAKPLPTSLEKSHRVALARGAWWLFLFVIALAFAGRNTKFVYVDF